MANLDGYAKYVIGRNACCESGCQIVFAGKNVPRCVICKKHYNDCRELLTPAVCTCKDLPLTDYFCNNPECKQPFDINCCENSQRRKLLKSKFNDACVLIEEYLKN